MLNNGQFNLGSTSEVKEFVAVANDTNIASFTDTNLSDTTTSFTATIDWGDGTTTTNATVIAGLAGTFTVEGGHTYSDENQYPALVTITRTADGSQLFIAGTVPVADTDNFSAINGKTITFTPNQPLTNVTVATFTDSNTSNLQTDFNAQIDWGDGTVTTGTVEGSAGSFSIVGSHTYTAPGEDTISVEFADDAPDANTGAATGKAVSGFGGQVTLTSVTEGTALAGVEVATFADTSASHSANDYTATIDWGDGTQSAGAISGSGQSFSVTGTHTYADEEAGELNGGSPVMKVTITRTVDSVTIAPTGTVAVADADFLTMTAKTVGTSLNQALTNVTVATFTDAYTSNSATDLVANIDWGDGSTVDVGTVSGSSGSFSVTGSHTYTADGQYNVNVTIFDDLPLSGQIGAVLSKANIGLIPGDFLLNSVVEGSSAPVKVATFTDGNTSDTNSAFTATIDWGDGQTTGGVVSGSNGSFTVSGTQAYADEGDDPVTVTLTRNADHDTSTVTGTVTVGEADSFVVTADNFPGNPGIAINNVQVATFTDTFAGQVAGDLAATINWGDGTSSAGTLSGGSGTFTVNGSHTYSTGGNYTFNVSVADDQPGNATANANGTATINFVSQMVLTNATEGTALPNNTPVATFSDSNGGDTTGSFTATINWGDGATTPGAVVGGAGSFTVEGGHTYADEGNDTATVILTRTADQAASTVSGNVAVVEGDVLTPQGTSFTANANQAFTGTVGTFSDSDTANVAGDFTASIDWGDGQTTTGTVSGGNGSFTVGGSHTYAAGGQDTVKVKLTDDAPGTAMATATTTASVRSLSGQMALMSATEALALPNSTPIATFSDTITSDSTSDFTATINWGDGTTTAGSVVGAGGSFTVEGGHTYADEGGNAASVTLTHTADQLQATASGTVSVSEGDVLTPLGTSFTANANQAFTGTVGTFSDTFTGNVAGDFTASIDWGDGQTTTGTVSGGNGSFTVGGSHTYAAGGQDTVKVKLTDDAPGTATATATTTATVRSLSGQMVLNSVTENVTLPPNTPVATFSDTDSSDAAGDFTATINWGDGTSQTGVVTGGGGTFTVGSPANGHSYGDEGSAQASVTLTHTSDQLQATAAGTVAIAEGDVLAGSGTSFTANQNQAFTGRVAFFFDTTVSANSHDDFTASIDWGDGQTTAGTITGLPGVFTVLGSHTYAMGGQDTVKVTFVDDAPGTATATATSTATVRSLSGQMALTSATEGSALPNSTPIATFSDTSTGDPASNFTATIKWGDGTTTAGTVVGSGGSFTVEGGHTYADEGGNAASVTLTDTVDQLQATASGTVSVGEGDVFTPQGTSITATAHQAFTGTLATFTDAYAAQVASDLAATIDWGDGQTTSGTVSGGNGSFTVGGSHTYAAPGQDTVKVTLADDAPGTATATATTTANVAPSSSIPFDFNGDTISDLVFQNEAFSIGSAAGTPQIWLWNGTAVTSQMTYAGVAASWHVVTSRDLNGDGNADLIWQNTDGTPGVWLMNGTTPLAQVGLVNPGTSWHLVASGDTNGDGKSDLIWQNTDGTLGLWLMNGTTPTAEVGLGNPGTNWKVVGTADYNADGRDDILLQDTNTGNLMIDLMNGTTIGSTKTITVGDPSWHAVSTGEFNGQAEIAWQNSNGTPGIWLMNGTTPVATAQLPNPGPGWQLISVDHFTPDGRAGLLFQNTNGAMGLWELNGTGITAMVGVPSPGAGWQSQNGHPFTATT